MPRPAIASWLPASYRQWNDALVDDLFPRGGVAAPVYLAVYDGLLEETGRRRGYGGRDAFIEAVLGVASSPGRFFERLEQLAELWTENDVSGPPPVVAGLALPVLAVGDMATDDTAKQTNYYVRLNALLGLDSRDMPKRFESTPEMWRMLRSWLRRERRGELMLRGIDGPRPFVDPVKSQCLVRSCDVAELQPLVASCGTTDPEYLLRPLAVWLAGPGAGSRLARILGRHPEEAALRQAADAICDACENYSAVEMPGAAEKKAPRRAVLAIQPNRYPNLMWRRAKWLLRLMADRDDDEAECLVQVGSRVSVARLDVRVPASYDTEISLADAVSILKGQVRAQDEDGQDVTPEACGIAWFHDGTANGRPGTWNLVEAPAAGVQHAVVFLAQHREEVERGIGRLDFVTGSDDVWPGPGVFGATQVMLGAGTAVGGTTAVEPPRFLRFVGGLRLRRGVYLRGALPCPAAAGEAPVVVESLEGSGRKRSTTAAGFSVIDLDEGRYSIECCGAASEISVVEPRWRECLWRETAPLDLEVRGSIGDSGYRGAVFATEHEAHAVYLPPGTHYRVYCPNVIKGFAPGNGGVHEHRTRQRPRQVVTMRRAPFEPCLPPAPYLSSARDGFDAGVTVPQPERMNRLVEYISALGSGTIDSLRMYCSLVVGDGLPWHSALSALEDLGHVDVCWERRTWCTAPPRAVPRADDPACAALTGRRARETLRVLRAAGVRVHVDERSADCQRAPMPDCIVADPGDIGRCAEKVVHNGLELAAPFSNVAALHVAPLSQSDWWMGHEFVPPLERISDRLEQWTPRELRWMHCTSLGESGLYRWRQHGRVLHYLVSAQFSGGVRDPSAAKWSLAPREWSSLGYERFGHRLIVPGAIGLPRVWRRICTLASGLLPVRSGRTLVYEHIPLQLARAIAIRLDQSRTGGLV